MPLSAGLAARFAAALDRLGPFEPEPLLAVAVSGGPDSLALALLAHGWAAARGGDVLALIVDHGLRRDSATEATLTQDRLAGQGIAACILRIAGLVRGPALAERARGVRYMVLEQACASRGIVVVPGGLLMRQGGLRDSGSRPGALSYRLLDPRADGDFGGWQPNLALSPTRL